jgi:hypothetical protein
VWQNPKVKRPRVDMKGDNQVSRWKTLFEVSIMQTDRRGFFNFRSLMHCSREHTEAYRIVGRPCHSKEKQLRELLIPNQQASTNVSIIILEKDNVQDVNRTHALGEWSDSHIVHLHLRLCAGRWWGQPAIKQSPFYRRRCSCLRAIRLIISADDSI